METPLITAIASFNARQSFHPSSKILEKHTSVGGHRKPSLQPLVTVYHRCVKLYTWPSSPIRHGLQWPHPRRSGECLSYRISQSSLTSHDMCRSSDLAQKLARDGPVKQEPCKRRVRGLLGNKWVFDTLDAEYVWEHPYCQSHLPGARLS